MYYWAWDWLKNNKTMKESDYPYVSGSTGQAEKSCDYKEDEGITSVSSYIKVKSDTESIKAAVKIGPVSVAVAAGNGLFQSYTHGIITEVDNCPTEIDHAVVIVGFGYTGNQGYYIVRNSWGTGWGEDGYVRIATHGGLFGVCGINQYVFYPTIA